MTETPRQPQPIAFLSWFAVKGLVTAEDIDARWSADPSVPDLVLGLVSQGVLERDAEFLTLSDDGDEFFSRACRSNLSAEEQSEVVEFNADFVEIDARFKKVATDWQRSNAHVGAGIDDAQMDALEGLLRVDVDLRSLVSGSGTALQEILLPYTRALEEARESLLSGDYSAFTGGGDTTYHSIWFVMHEIILRTSGLTR